MLRTSKALLLIFLACAQAVAQGFTDRAAEYGVMVTHDLDEIEDSEWGTGAAWIDYDRDGDLDLYVTNRAGQNQFFENQVVEGQRLFTDVTSLVGLGVPVTDCSGLSVADYNNDSFPDIYIATAQTDRLFTNDGGTGFVDDSDKLNMTSQARGTSVSWIDFDNDGYLDLYLSNHVPAQYILEENLDTNDYLLHNVAAIGGGREFEDASFLLADFGQLAGSSFANGWIDYDDDGDFDLMVTNDCTGEWPTDAVFYENLGPSGSDWTTWQFDTVEADIGLSDCNNAMGLSIGDINHDGRMDMVHSNIGGIRLWKNNGGSFTDIAASAGIDIQPKIYYSWGVNFADFDNDTWQDIILSCGYLNEISDGCGLDLLQQNYYFHNNGDETFSNWSDLENFNDDTRSRTSVVADWDNDGDLDVYVVNYDDMSQFYENHLDNGNHYFKINLEGVISNRDGIGAKVKLVPTGGDFQYAVRQSGSSLGGGDSPILHFGIGTSNSIDLIEVTWPSGIIQTLHDMDADTMITILEDISLPTASIRVDLIEEAGVDLLVWEHDGMDKLYTVEAIENGRVNEIGSVDSRNFGGKLSYDLSDLKSGNYLLRVSDGDMRSNTVRYSNFSIDDVVRYDAGVRSIFLEENISQFTDLLLTDAAGRSNDFNPVNRRLEFIELPSGIYFFSGKFRGEKFVKKIVVH